MTTTPDDAAATLADVGEFGLLARLGPRLSQSERIELGPGDDAAVVAAPEGRVLLSTDLHVDTRHFRRDWASAVDIGHKVAAANLSDMNAMGGHATALLVGLAAPADLPVAWALELADGIAEEAALVGASLAGGDLSAADQLMISISVLGAAAGAVVTRAGARPGDVLALAGRQGWAAAGLAVLARGFRSPRTLVEAYRRPEPPYAAGPQAAALGATSMIDVSDGLVADVGHLAASSGVAIDVHAAGLDLAEPLRAVGAALGTDPLRFLLGGGDDHALVATFPAGTELPEPWRLLGQVSEGEGVTVDGQPHDGPPGHRHF